VNLTRSAAGTWADAKPSDSALLRAFLTYQDQAAFEALVLRHGPMVQRICRRTLGHVHDAEDAFQATFLAPAQQAASIRKRESLASWLHGVAYRMATHAKRAAARRHKHESRANPGRPQDPGLTASWQEIQALIDEEIVRPPETLRAPSPCRGHGRRRPMPGRPKCAAVWKNSSGSTIGRTGLPARQPAGCEPEGLAVLV
jgi:Sigma-70 region 2